MSERKKRRQVRVENPAGACGYIGHMTVDELRARAVGENIDCVCPVCGLVHLTREEIVELERQKVRETKRFNAITKEAEAQKK